MTLNTLNLNNIVDISVFLLLNFLAVAGRLSYDVEVKKIRFKLSSFFNRLFITIIFTYIAEIFILKNDKFREYYTQIILLVAFFMIDIINLVIKYKDKIFIYILSMFSKGIQDISNQITKNKDNESI